MKISFYLAVLITILSGCSQIIGQEFNLIKFINETQSVARKTGYQNNLEFNYSFNRTRETKDGKRISENYESVCSKKRCEYILTAKNGKSLSEKKIIKNREQVAKRLEKADVLPENKQYVNKELSSGYGFMINTSFSRKHSYFNPSLYLKNCQIGFVEKALIENRPTVKLRASECNVDNDENKGSLQFMPETEAVILVDEQDTAVVKLEVYYKNKSSSSLASAKPVVMMKAKRIPEGFWFWHLITTNASGNENFFSEDDGNLQIELYGYRPFTITVEKEKNRQQITN